MMGRNGKGLYLGGGASRSVMRIGATKDSTSAGGLDTAKTRNSVSSRMRPVAAAT